MRTYKTEGIVLKRFDYGEADRILTVFTKHYGKISCLAKGVRKPISRKKGDVELFSWLSLFLAKGKSLDLLTETKLVNNFSLIASNLKKTFFAWQLCELIDRLLPQKQSNPEVFELIKDNLLIISRPGQLANDFLIEFKKKLLVILGFGLPGKIDQQSLDNHIEEIIERKINSKSILKTIEKTE